MRRRVSILAAVMIGVSAQTAPLVAQRGAQPAAPKPNIVLIIMDDMGYGDIGSYGVTDARTPNIDRAGARGRAFDRRVRKRCELHADARSSHQRAVSAARRHRMAAEFGRSGPGPASKGTSLPALLKTSGYATGLIGKWHLGFNPEFGPNAHGFDEFFGFLSGAVDYYTHRRGDGTHELFENTTPVEAPEYLTDEITRRAVRFIDNHAAGPFFLEVAYNAVHWPFQPPDQRRQTRRGAAAPRKERSAIVPGARRFVPATRQRLRPYVGARRPGGRGDPLRAGSARSRRDTCW